MEVSDSIAGGHGHLIDAGAVAILLGVLANVLPTIATLLTILWMVIRIWETETVQRMLGRMPPKNPPVPGGDDDADPV